MINLQNREKRINWLYNHYLNGFDIEMLEKTSESLNPKQIRTVEKIISQKVELEELIKTKLKDDWPWDRIENLEKAVLLNGIAEIKLFKLKPAIVIAESNKYIRKFIDKNDTNKWIQGILNNVKEA